jgi:hypothetical protein
MAEFLHEITKKREEVARIDAMINRQDTWASEEVMLPEWERILYASIPPPPLTLQQDTSWDIGQE